MIVRLELTTDYIVTDPYALLQSALDDGFEPTGDELQGIDLLHAITFMDPAALAAVCADALLHLTNIRDYDGTLPLSSEGATYGTPTR